MKKITTIITAIIMASNINTFGIPVAATNLYDNATIVSNSIPETIDINSSDDITILPSIKKLRAFVKSENFNDELYPILDDYLSKNGRPNTLGFNFDKTPKCLTIITNSMHKIGLDEQAEVVLKYYSTDPMIYTNLQDKITVIPAIPYSAHVRREIANTYIKNLKIWFRKEHKSFVEYKDENGNTVNPLESYLNRLNTALSAPELGDIEQMFSEIGITITVPHVLTSEQLEALKWKILIDEEPMYRWKSILDYTLGVENFNAFVDEYNKGTK